MKKFRRIETTSQQKEEKKTNKSAIYLAIFLAVIMVGGIAGIFVGSPSEQPDYTYGTYTFKSKGNYWATNTDAGEINFYFLPEQVNRLSVESAAFQRIKSSQGIIVTFDPDINTTERLQAIDIFRFEFVNALLSEYRTKQVGYAMNQESTAYALPVITCQNASFSFPVLQLEYGNETKTTLMGNCIVVSAIDEYSLISMLDALKYRIYGIFDETTA